MRFPDADAPQDPVAGPSSVGLDHPVVTNGAGSSSSHTNGFTNGAVKSNGHSKQSSASAAGRTVPRVVLPGTSLYPDEPDLDREEFMRLVIQSLRDVGYHESAATLEAESGYAMESPQVAEFRQYISEGQWAKAENVLGVLGVGLHDPEHLPDAKFLINEQKYLELLEAQRTTDAVYVLRNEIAPLGVDTEKLNQLSSLIMCAKPSELRDRAQWDGAAGNSRRILLDNLHRYIHPSIMVPPRRFATLLHQAHEYQRQQCIYHNTPSTSSGYSLFADHQCDKTTFPRITTTILEVHTNEVWVLEWSRSGNLLASSSADKMVIIWGQRPATDSSSMVEWEKRHSLLHPYGVISMAWSLDDSVLVTGSENHIKMWNTKTGVCVRTLEEHSEPVTSLIWLPDNSGFFSAGLDLKIISWSIDGSRKEVWAIAPVRIASMVLTPDCTRFVVIGLRERSPLEGRPEGETGAGSTTSAPPPKDEHRMLVYDLDSKRIESSLPFEGELTSLSVSRDSHCALVNSSPDDIQLWDLHASRLVRRYTGQRQSTDIIRSCFGGIENNFIVSGSEDGNVYIWHRDTGVLLEVLEGHGAGSVNCVAWNPRNDRMFASCSDDHSIRIWESADVLDGPVRR
ncbi:WD-domain-containing protein [Mycena chlorophos]|uniref:WD-domain-containing protein n=1 Tax=Mycena chlorophos TaxID=658473 RepID=A0A8H6WKZ6_MYCCL|nr:WD-domain-containing protein [Mycena chlorophos]